MSGGGSVFTGVGSTVDAFPANHPFRELTDAVVAIENAVTKYPALTDASGHIAADVTLTNANQSYKIFDTASLAVGTWWVMMGGTFVVTAAAFVAMAAAVDSATGTLTGIVSTEFTPSAANYEGHGMLSFIAVITVAGTLQLTAEASNPSCIAKAAGSTYANAAATGYTAVRVA